MPVLHVCWRSQVKDKKLEFGVCILWVFSLNGHTFVLSLYCKHLTVESVFFSVPIIPVWWISGPRLRPVGM